MKETISNNLFAIHSSNYQEGCGFFIGNRFFTSGHIIAKAQKPFIKICGEEVNLKESIFYQYDELDSNNYDLAVFEISNFNSNLELYEYAIEPRMTLISKSYKTIDKGTVFIETEVITQGQEGNYFCGISKANLKSGSSGSPVLIGNKVVGILTKGNNNDFDEPMNPDLPLNFCMFLSASAIRNVIIGNHIEVTGPAFPLKI